MKKYSSSSSSSSRTKYFLAFLILIAFAVSGLIVANQYLTKPIDEKGQASTANVIPPTTQRQTVPSGALILNGGTGITNRAAMTAGNFQVEAYCGKKGLGTVSQTNNDWLCGSYKLQVTDYDAICQLTYPSSSGAFVIRTGTSPTPAFNWRCYAFPGGATTAPSASPTTSSANPGNPGIACGAPCGGQSNGQTLPYNCANGGICGNTANGGSSGNLCLPKNAPGYVMKGGICANDPNTAVFCLNKADGTRVLDAAGVQAACAAAAGQSSSTPTPTPQTGASGISDLNHNGKADPDDYRLFIEDYRLQLSKQ